MSSWLSRKRRLLKSNRAETTESTDLPGQIGAFCVFRPAIVRRQVVCGASVGPGDASPVIGVVSAHRLPEQNCLVYGCRVPLQALTSLRLVFASADVVMSGEFQGSSSWSCAAHMGEWPWVCCSTCLSPWYWWHVVPTYPLGPGVSSADAPRFLDGAYPNSLTGTT